MSADPHSHLHRHAARRVRLIDVDPQGPLAMALLHQAAAEALALYPELFGANPPPPSNAPLALRGVYLCAVADGPDGDDCHDTHDGQPLACGALRPLDDTTAEVRRMFVTAAARRRGLASLILRALEARAQALGYARLLLETGHRQGPAIALYQARGFTPIAPFGEHVGDPTSVCFTKLLPVTVQATGQEPGA